MDPVLVWNDVYSIGIPEIDDQHKVLFDLINELWGAIVNQPIIEEQVKLIMKLEQYTISHFTEEETFMQAFEYPDFDKHKKKHDSFVKKIAHEKANLQATLPLSLDILIFLKDWLVNHILVSDRAYAKYRTEKATHISFVSEIFNDLFGSL